MVSQGLWHWLYVVWAVTWLAEAINPSTASVCGLGPCSCDRGKLLCDCSTSVVKEITLKEELFNSYSFSSIIVTNCSHLHVASQVLSGLPALQQISISEIARLTMEEKSFMWTTDNPKHSGLLINITDCTIPEIPSFCFRGSLRDILLSSVNVSLIRAFAFSSIDHADKIDFTRVSLNDIEPQSFKKFSVNFLTFSNSSVKVFPTRAMIDVNVHEDVRFDNVQVGRIETEAFKIHGSRNFRLVQSTVGHVEENAFLVHTKGDLSIHDNIFSHLEDKPFLGISVDGRYVQEAGKQDLIFENNTLVNFETGSLSFNTSGFDIRLDWIMINQSCSCESVQLWVTELVSFSSDPTSKSASPEVSTVMFCLSPKFTNVQNYQRLHCNTIKSSLWVKVLIVVGVFLVLATFGAVVYCSIKRRAKRYINVPTTPAALKSAGGNHILVLPDGKTYRETELHVIVDHVEPIIATGYVKERPDRGDSQ